MSKDYGFATNRKNPALALWAKQSQAQIITRKAIRAGELIDPRTLLCVDCGGMAKFYDHRKYSEPLTVAPVCHSCNVKRGPAEDSPDALRSFRPLQPQA